MADETRSGRFRPGPDIVAQRLGDELVLIHLKTDRMFVLNRTGARVWELLATGVDVVEIQKRVLQEFEVAEAELTTDVQDLVHSLRTEQLISPDD